MPENTSRILVTGATGSIGEDLVRMLADAGAPFRVMCHRPEQVAAFTARGVDATAGDFTDAGSLRAALDGCDQLFLLPPVTPDLDAHARAAVDAASAAGVRHVVKVTASDADPGSPVPWAAAHARADRHLRDSDLAWTLLRATAFMDNLAQTAPLVRRGLLPGTSRDGATTWVATTDIAAAAARVLLDPTTQGGAAEQGRDHLLTGTEPLSYPDVARVMSAELGHRVRYLHLPRPLMYLGLRAGGQSAWLARGLVRQFGQIVRHGRDGVLDHSTDLADLLGRSPTDMATYVRAHLDTFS
jgi:uncharacterized protein YbjT (DUF2867 family)